MVAGGLLMAVLWLVFTRVHGPTSFNQDEVVLGGSMNFWGSMLGGPPNLLVAFGLMLLYPRVVKSTNLLTRVGYALTLVGLIVPAGMDLLIWGALGPPFFVPVVGIGLVLLASGNWHHAKVHRQSLSLLMLLGVFQLIAFGLALVPLGVSDQIGGYRLYGLFAHFATGIGWVMLGVRFWKTLIGVAPAVTPT